MDTSLLEEHAASIVGLELCGDVCRLYRQGAKKGSQSELWNGGGVIQHISFIFIPWICTGLQNPYGYGNTQIYLRNLEVKSI